VLEWFENRIPPPLVMLATALVMWGATRYLPTTALPAVVRFGLGVVLIGTGVYLDGRALLAFRKAGTTVNPIAPDKASALVTSGVYAITRNPMYVGMASLLTGLAFLLSDLWLLIGPLAFVLYINLFQIGPEERVMQAKFGESFTAYKARVKRWI
jgi:protein-S-isoprenylcysteine O-methyltransferase Ste14